MIGARKVILSTVLICTAVPIHLVHATVLKTYVMDSFGNKQLLHIIQPMLAQGGSVRMYQQKIILHTTPQNYQEIQRLLKRIDKIPDTLQVSLKLVEHRVAKVQGYGGQIVISARRKRIAATGDVYYAQHSQNSRTNNQYHVSTLSGSAATISAGTLQRFATSFWQRELVAINQGMVVTPILLPNNQVRLQVQQQFNHTSNSDSGYGYPIPIHTQGSVTSRVIPLGKWQQIGSINQDERTHGHSNERYHTQSLAIMIKVQKLR